MRDAIAFKMNYNNVMLSSAYLWEAKEGSGNVEGDVELVLVSGDIQLQISGLILNHRGMYIVYLRKSNTSLN